MFEPVSAKVDFVRMEQDVMKWWEEQDILEKYLHANDDSPRTFSFIDGPITANNPMGVHHAWGRTYKDVFQRYKTMRGFKQRYQNGFDGQGLWIEVEVEKELKLNDKREIEDFGIDRFVELCKERVRKFAAKQTEQSVRLGYWMQWDNSYHTMSDENNYTIWHFLKVCHERGWVYEGTDVMPWCPRCGTGLSEHEIVTEGYQEIVHPGLYVRFPLIGRDNEALLVWTTTPWTLAANTAAYVHPELIYAKARTENGEVLYLLKSRLSELKAGHEVLEEMPGAALAGLRYKGPFDELPVQQGVDRRVVAWKEVSESEGTGVVHTAPGAGKEDFKLSKQEGLDVIAPLDDFGAFVDGFDWLSGKSVFEVNGLIYDSLRQKGVLYRLEQYTHRYPVCWRCGTELVFRLVDEWFISMGELRSMIADVARKVTWIPSFGLERELDWLRNMDDWMISKKRYWGLALPIFKCECGHFEVIGSETELAERAVEGMEQLEGHSPHRPWIDAVRIECGKCGKRVARIKDVGNPWLDAGIVPFSTLGYRHDRDYWREWFPGDLITESFPGQFRNWFYSLLTMSTVLEGVEPTRAIHSYALMRDEKGAEMHKSKGNAIWFEDAAERMGADAMRWVYCLHNPATNLNFGFGVADEARRRFMITLWNVYSFFVTYANIDEFDPIAEAPAVEDRPDLDRWIISELNTLVRDMTRSLDGYATDPACRAAERFVDYLSNWYVRRSRRRFWKSAADQDKLAAHATLYECLVTLNKLLAPAMPFMTESVHQNLARSNGGAESVHLEAWPEENPAHIDPALSDATRLAMRLSSLGRSARSKTGLKVRQPLQKVLVGLRSSSEAATLETVSDQLLEELNVKEVAAIESATEVSSFEARANMALVGPKYGSDTPKVLSALSAADPIEVYNLVSSGRPVPLGDYALGPDEIVVNASDKEGYSVASEGGYTVAVTTEVNAELASEGGARELVHRIQNMRRSAGFDIADRIETFYLGDGGIEAVIEAHGGYIRQETLSDTVVSGEPPSGAYTESHNLDGAEVTIGVRKT